MGREIIIQDGLHNHWNFVNKWANENGYTVVALFLQGSQNYELDLYTDEYRSDIDTKSIVLPKFDDFVLGKEPVNKTIVLDNDEHCEVKDIRIMFDMFRKANISYIELLYTDYYIVNPKFQWFFDELRGIRDDIIDYCRLFKTCYGMTLEKRKALCHPYPTIKWKIDKWGYDGKQLSHLIRIHFFLQQIRKDGFLDKNTFVPDDDIKEDLITIKLNKLDKSVDEVVASADGFCDMTKELVDDMIENYDWDEPDMELLDDLLLRTIRIHFKNDILNGEVVGQ